MTESLGERVSRIIREDPELERVIVARLLDARVGIVVETSPGSGVFVHTDLLVDAEGPFEDGELFTDVMNNAMND